MNNPKNLDLSFLVPLGLSPALHQSNHYHRSHHSHYHTKNEYIEIKLKLPAIIILTVTNIMMIVMS